VAQIAHNSKCRRRTKGGRFLTPTPPKAGASLCTDCARIQRFHAQLVELLERSRVLCKVARRLHSLYCFLSLLLISNNLGHLLFARKLTPAAKTNRVLTHFCHSQSTRFFGLRGATAVRPPALNRSDFVTFATLNAPCGLGTTNDLVTPIGCQRFRSTRLARSQRVFPGAASARRLLERLRESCP